MPSIPSIVALGTLAGAAAAHAAEPETYRCERLINGIGHVFDINDRGHVAGYVEVPKHGTHGAVWRHRRAEALPNPVGHEDGQATALAINRQGDMVGSLTVNLYEPVLWKQGVATLLPHLSDNHLTSGQARDINAHGHIVGYSSNAQGVAHATLWKNGKVIDLGALDGPNGAARTTSYASAINASGMVVGQSESNSSSLRAVQWTAGRDSIVDLGATAFGAFSDAKAVNGLGVVVGVSSVSGNEQLRRPIAWIDGASFDLKPPAGAAQSRAEDINDDGTVVGAIDSESRGALVWPHYRDKPIDLNTLVDANGCRDGTGRLYRLTFAGAINNRGEILAGSYGLPPFQSFRLVPVTKR